MKYELIIFDMDGTILNTLKDLSDSLNYALRRSHLPLRTLEQVRSFVGDGIRCLIERATPPNTDPDTLERIYQDFIPYYKEHSADTTRPYSGILELLRAIKRRGYHTAVVSNKADAAVAALCEVYFHSLFDITIGEHPSIPKKPAPDMINLVLERSGVSKEKCVYIGDSDVDVATAANSGLDFIAVDWGFRDADLLKEKGAEIIVSTPLEILSYI